MSRLAATIESRGWREMHFYAIGKEDREGWRTQQDREEAVGPRIHVLCTGHLWGNL
jgi:hypothetical protein